MREIKFRLRDRHNKIVGYEKWYEGHWHLDNDLKLSPDSGYWEAKPCWLYSLDGEEWTPNYIPHRYKDGCVSLKDKNGKEIYEGDIVRFHSGKKEWTHQVIWRDREALFAVMDSKGWGSFALQDLKDLEVIGDIYENPELLDK